MLSETTPNGTVQLTYNAANQPTSMTAANRPPVNYGYDQAGRLQTITQGAETFTYAYDALSRLASLQRPNGVRTAYNYDSVGRVVRLSHTNGLNQPLEDFNFSYNKEGEIESIESIASAQQLPSAKNAGPADAANRITQFGQASYAFDDSGMMTAKTDSQGTTNYRWDARGRLVQTTPPDGQAVSYTYDALGRRSSRTANNSTTSFLYSGRDVVLDQRSDGQQVDYLNGVGIDSKLRQSSAATGALYFLQDQLGSTAALTDTGGNVVDRQQYDAFGESQGSTLTRYGYTGRERDDVTGLVYYRARWYDPQQGRFISQDPIAQKGGMNLYAYVGNNPLTQVDPLGLRAIKLSQCVKDLLKPFFPDIDLDKVRIHDDGLPWWSKFNTIEGGAGAITFGNDIWFPAGGYNPYSSQGIAAIAHELVHVGQFNRLGYAGFIKQYGQSYIDNIKKQLPSGGPGLPPIFPFDGVPLMDTAAIKAVEFLKWMNDVRKWAQKSHPPLDLDKAYRDINLEKDAYDFEKDLKRYFDEIGDPYPCKVCEQQ